MTGLWQEICDSTDAATFFHTPAWAGVIAQTFPQWSSDPIVTEFSNGNKVVFPLMRRRAVSLRSYYESMPAGVYGGPLFSQPPTPADLQACLEMLGKLPSVIVYGNPFCDDLDIPANHARNLHTHVLDLRRGGERIEKGFRKGHRANISTARRKGVEISIACDLKEVDDYFAVYQNSIARWGEAASGFYPKRLFQNLFRLPQYGNSVKLWLAKCEGRIAAGAWIFYQSEHAVYWHGAVHVDYLNWHPVHLMLENAIRAAAAEGLRWFDFNPSGGLKGVEHFKRGFGAERRDFVAYRRLGPLAKAFRFRRYVEQSVLKKCTV